jgi:hypothetical protein
MFYYCQLYLNGAIDKKQYVDVTSTLFKDAYKLINLEIDTDSNEIDTDSTTPTN